MSQQPDQQAKGDPTPPSNSSHGRNGAGAEKAPSPAPAAGSGVASQTVETSAPQAAHWPAFLIKPDGSIQPGGPVLHVIHHVVISGHNPSLADPAPGVVPRVAPMPVAGAARDGSPAPQAAPVSPKHKGGGVKWYHVAAVAAVAVGAFFAGRTFFRSDQETPTEGPSTVNPVASVSETPSVPSLAPALSRSVAPPTSARQVPSAAPAALPSAASQKEEGSALDTKAAPAASNSSEQASSSEPFIPYLNCEDLGKPCCFQRGFNRCEYDAPAGVPDPGLIAVCELSQYNSPMCQALPNPACRSDVPNCEMGRAKAAQARDRAAKSK